jgi:hypothetical protein
VARCASAGVPADDTVQIECVLRDANGEVACDERVVSVDVVGGELLGLENGDLRDNTPYAQNARRTLDGRLILFVRTGADTTVVLSSPGLAELRMECGS